MTKKKKEKSPTAPKSWRNWGDHPLVVTIATLAALITILSVVYEVYNNNVKNSEGNNSAPQNNPMSMPPLLPGGNNYSWFSKLVVQNIGESESTIKLNITSNDQNTSITKPNISPGNARLIDFNNENVPSRFAGAISSYQPINVIEFMEGYKNEEKKASIRLSLKGQAIPANVLYFPVAKLNYYGVSTRFIIQNPPMGEVTKFNAKLKLSNGSSYDYTSPDISPGDSFEFSLNNFSLKELNNLSGIIGSVIVSSNDELVGVAYEHKSDDVYQIISFYEALYNSEATNQDFIPERGNGDIVNIHMINADTKPGAITVTYGRVGDDNICTNKIYSVDYKNVQPNDFISLLQQNINPFEKNCWLWATITGTIKFVAGVSEANSLNQPSNNSYYKPWPLEKLGNQIALPFFADNYAKLVSLMQIQNPSADKSATAVAEFNCETENNIHYQAKTKPLHIRPDFAFQIKEPSINTDLFEPAQLMYPNSWCAVIIRSDQPIVAFIREISRDPGLVSRVDYDAEPLPVH